MDEMILALSAHNEELDEENVGVNEEEEVARNTEEENNDQEDSEVDA